tara:strand:+ start:86 stop:406 length:321 start_codon:yes stop_codon:yes gene_type:complete
MQSPIEESVIKITIDSCKDIDLSAKGLDLVLSTWISIFLSKISLITHPADRIIKAPKINIIKRKIFCRISSIDEDALIRPHKHGYKSNMDPIGLFNRISNIYDLIL